MFKIPNIAKQQFVRFMLMGFISTVAMYLLYLLFRLFIYYQLAYLFSYVIGVIISYYLNVLFVFDKKVSLATFIRFPLVYVVQYGISAIFLGIFVESLGVPETYAPLIILALTTPLSFWLSRYMLS